MTTYYKATRATDPATDFRTGRIRYVVGETVTHPTSTKRTRDNPSTYLSVATVPTDCTGFRWPCRLFAVEGVGRAMTSTEYPNKRAFLAVRVVEELPAHEVFGPQGQEVVALIERAGRLTADEMSRLSAARSAVWATAWDAAWSAVWATAWDAAWDAARDAARAAAWALIVRDLIPPETFKVLYAPWRSVIEGDGP